MNTVLLYGKKDSDLELVLFETIRAVHYSILHITGNTISLIPPQAVQPDFLVIDNFFVPNLLITKGIVVFKQGISVFQKGIDIPQDYIAVVDPENEEAIAMLKKNSMRTVTCGMSAKDTITYSSIDPECAIVSLQRELKTVGGEDLDPGEFPIKALSCKKDFALLAAVAVLLLSGIKLPDGGINV